MFMYFIEYVKKYLTFKVIYDINSDKHGTKYHLYDVISKECQEYLMPNLIPKWEQIGNEF